MNELVNRCVVLAQRPEVMPTEACWRLEERSLAALVEQQVPVDIDTISIDPAMRWKNSIPGVSPCHST